MGKKVKQQQQQQPEPEVQEQQVQTARKQPLEKYLPHNKYIAKRSKLLLKKKQQTLSFVKLDKHQVNNAVTSLKEFIQRTKNVKDLFQGGNEGFIYLEIDLSEVPQHYSVRPIQIPLPHPIYNDKYNSRFAVFTMDPESQFIDHIKDLSLPLLSQTVGYQRSKKHFRNNKEKLKLLNANDLFFCDWKIYNLLRKPLGKLFYEKKKYPFPINCEEVPEELQQQFPTYEEYLNSLTNSTYTMLGNGPVYTLKVGRLDMSNGDLVKNIMRAAFRFLPYVTEEVGIDKVRQISIKGYNSPSLPIYNYVSAEEVEIYERNRDLIKQKEIQQKQNKQKTV